MKDINKILAKVQYKKELNAAKTEKIKTDYDLIIADEQLKEINNRVKLVNSIKFSGIVLYMLSLLGLVASTSLSLAGGVEYYNDMSKYAFIIAICFVQLVIFKVSTFESVVKIKFNNHYPMFKILQYGLLTVSIYYNYDFFAKHSVGFKPITLILCVLLDVSVIKFVSLAWDSKRLNYSEIDDIESIGLLRMISFNILFKFRIKMLKTYKENVKTLKQAVSKGEKSFEQVKTDIEKEPLKETIISSKLLENREPDKDIVKTPSVTTSKDNVVSLNKRVLNIKTDVKTNNVKNLLVKTYKDGDLVDVKTLKTHFSLTAREWMKIKKEISELETKGTNTYYVESKNTKRG